uniref:NAD(P)(+)--arginine ADP-ribosyltransferase n=1 Tax=Salarias fasciatus TaxID=181472 RepID=A0A672I0N7_SALFA
MWDRSKVLLATICFTALFCHVSIIPFSNSHVANELSSFHCEFLLKAAAGNGELLGWAPGVVNDLYRGCRQQAMEKFVHSGLLKQELNNSVGFQKAWTLNSKCSALIPGGIDAHTFALSAYLLSEGEDFVKAFDKAVQTMSANVSTYENDFHFKSLYFLLMDAITLLNPKTCQTVFVLPEKTPTPKKGSRVTFGSFTVATSNFQALKKLEDFDGRVLLNITSCFSASVGEHICDSDKDKVLLSPAEDFIVEEVTKKEDDNESTYTEIVLKNLKMNSTHNCFSFSRSPAAVSTLWLPSALVILSFLYSAA